MTRGAAAAALLLAIRANAYVPHVGGAVRSSAAMPAGAATSVRPCAAPRAAAVLSVQNGGVSARLPYSGAVRRVEPRMAYVAQARTALNVLVIGLIVALVASPAGIACWLLDCAGERLSPIALSSHLSL